MLQDVYGAGSQESIASTRGRGREKTGRACVRGKERMRERLSDDRTKETEQDDESEADQMYQVCACAALS